MKENNNMELIYKLLYSISSMIRGYKASEEYFINTCNGFIILNNLLVHSDISVKCINRIVFLIDALFTSEYYITSTMDVNTIYEKFSVMYSSFYNIYLHLLTRSYTSTTTSTTDSETTPNTIVEVEYIYNYFIKIFTLVNTLKSTYSNCINEEHFSLTKTLLEKRLQDLESQAISVQFEDEVKTINSLLVVIN
jgi:hypothetical protein